MNNHDELRQLWAETLAAAPSPTETVGVRAQVTTWSRLPTAQLVRTVDSAADSAEPGHGDRVSVTDETLAAADPALESAETLVAQGLPANSAQTAAAGPELESAETVVAQDATFSSADTAAPTSTTTARHRVQRRLDQMRTGPVPARFDLLHKVGAGGMGVVWCARQESLGREVAIKTLRSKNQGPERRSRFVAEAVVTGRLDHPNVVPVHELGEDAEGGPFLAMKLVRGRSWERLLRPTTPEDREEAAKWDVRRHIDVLLQVSNGVAYAHAHGLIHRDIKPENVMVGDYGEVLVMDWGIAVHVGDERPADGRLPHRDDVHGPAGTPAYMAPEQAEGRGERLGTHTDIFLLGAALHEVLTGAPPHAGTELFEVLLAASRAEPKTYGHDVPAALAAVCAKAMERDPAARYASVEAFQEALREWLEHEASLRLSDEASAEMRALRTDGDVPQSERYGRWSRALGRFEQALSLWPGNVAASMGQATAAMAYAEEALSQRDVGLAKAQLALLERHPHADQVGLQALQNAVSRGQLGGARVALGLVLGVALLGAATWGLQAAADDVAHQEARDARRAHLRQALLRGWEAVAVGEPSAALRQVSSDEVRTSSVTQTDRLAVQDLRLAGLLALWRDARWDALARHACHALTADAGGDATLAAVSRGANHVQRGRGNPCARLLSVARGTAPRVRAATRSLKHDVAPRDRRVASLLEIGVCGRQRALQLPGAATVCRDWVAETVPMAHPATGTVEPPELGPGPWGELVARDTFAGAVLWHTQPTRPADRDTQGGRYAPVRSGHVLTATHAVLQLRHGRTGEVMARRGLPGRVLMISPDPLDRGALLVSVAAHSRPHREHIWLTLRAEDRGPPPTSGDVAAFASLGTLHEATADVAETPESLVNSLLQGVRTDPGDVDAALSLLALEASLPTTCAEDKLQIGERTFDQCLTRSAATARIVSELGGRAALVQAAVTGSATLPVLAQVLTALRLDRAGLSATADTLLVRAQQQQRQTHVNAELAVSVVGTPAGLLRRAGDWVWERGGKHRERRRRALTWLRDSLGFSLALEGDGILAPAMVRWLRAHPDEAPPGLLAALPPHVQAARALGDNAFVERWRVQGLDVALGGTFVGPMALLVLFAWFWLRARRARLSALYARGFRTRRERVAAFLTFPLMRLKHTTWSYMTRHERLVVLATSALTVFTAVVFVTGADMLQHLASAEATLATGRLDAPGVQRALDRRMERHPPTAAFYRMQAEAAWSRGDRDAARAQLLGALRLDPDDLRSRNNLALLDEVAGRRDAARAAYAATSGAGARRAQPGDGAASGPRVADTTPNGAGAAAAAFNLARLSGAPLPVDALAPRDARDASTAAPLWARVDLLDLREVAMPALDRQEAIRRTVAKLVGGKTATSLMTVVGRTPLSRRFAESVSSLIAAGCLIAMLSALVWLPMPVMPTPASPPPPKGQAGLTGAWERLLAAMTGLRGGLSYAPLLGWLALVGGLAAPLWLARFGIRATALLNQVAPFPHYFDGVRGVPAADVALLQIGTAVATTCLVLAVAVCVHGLLRVRRQLR